VATVTGRRSKYLRCMKAKRFVEAVMQLKFAEVLDDGDFRRVNDCTRRRSKTMCSSASEYVVLWSESFGPQSK
jgi:hypothetical protein